MRLWENKKILRFFIVVLGVYIFWAFFDNIFPEVFAKVNLGLRTSEAQITSWILNFFHFETYVKHHPNPEIDHVRVFTEDIRGFVISNACNGLVLFVVYTGFILALPGRILIKSITIVFGIVLIYLFNLIRIVSLFLIFAARPDLLDFNHKYTFTILVYGFIFLLWYWYVNRYIKPKQAGA